MKRLFDLTLIVFSLPVLMPVFVLVALLVRIKLGSPIFFTQKRPGLAEKPFKMVKFRTMTDERDEQGELLPDSMRLTKFGKFLRSTSLDELPGLWSVLKGDMSLVGPRPLLMEYLPLYSVEQARRHEVRPGVSGWAQVNGRNAISWEDKFKFDVWYVDNHTLWLDIKIIWLTLKKVIVRDGISSEGEVTMSAFRGTKNKCKNIIVVGAGGFALELLGYLEQEQSQGLYKDYAIKGIVDDSLQNYEHFSNVMYFPYLGSIDDFFPVDGDVFWVAIGSQPHRRNVIEALKRKNVSFFSFVSSMSYVNKTVKLGVGIIIAPFCMVNANVDLGDYALLNSYSAIGHDSKVGGHAILYPYAAINGSCHVGEELIMGTRATIFPGTNVGNRCIVTTHSYVKADKGDNRFIHLKAKEIDLENCL